MNALKNNNISTIYKVLVDTLMFSSFAVVIVISLKRTSFFAEHWENATRQDVFLTFLAFSTMISIYGYFMYKKSVEINPVLIILIFVGLFIAPPFFSQDSYGYMIRAKNFSLLKQNPLITPLNYSAENPWAKSINTWWVDKPSSQGPVFNLVTGYISYLTEELIIAVYYYKVVVLVLYGFSFYFFAKICDLLHLENNNRLFFLYNPAVLIHTIMDGHNEIMVVTLTLIVIYLTLSTKEKCANVVNCIAAAVKYLNLLILPYFWFFNRKSSTKNIFISIIALGIIITGTTAILGYGKINFGTLVNNRHYTNSIGCLYSCTPFVSIIDTVFPKYGYIIRSVLFMCIYISALKLYAIKNQKIIKFIWWVFFDLLFVYVSWFAPWYTTTLIPIGILLIEKKEKTYRLLTLLVTSKALLHYFPPI